MYNIDDIYEKLLSFYGDPHWWPGETPYEIMVGAVLTQNCAWSNVEKAIANLKAVCDLTPEAIAEMDNEKLAGLIRPAGFFTRKALYLKAITKWYEGYGYSVENVRQNELYKMRKEILSVKGIGNETADSILLYAFGMHSFVIDAYTGRLCKRFPIEAGETYETKKRFFETHFREGNASTAEYNNFHALIVINAKEHCNTKPRCGGCPLEKLCRKEIE
jgi:endonuclease-3 related protein